MEEFLDMVKEFEDADGEEEERRGRRRGGKRRRRRRRGVRQPYIIYNKY